jgi:hypothetical protein
VAEHLPPASAPLLVRALTEAAPIVVFSAALPGQGGDGHVNEQLPSYWARLFDDCGYACYSDLRTRIWRNERVEVWYRQNLLCFVAKSSTLRLASVLKEFRGPDSELLDVAHPALLLRHAQRADGLQRYAERVEREIAKDSRELAAVKRILLSIVNSPPWRLWQRVSRRFLHQ